MGFSMCFTQVAPSSHCSSTEAEGTAQSKGGHKPGLLSASLTSPKPWPGSGRRRLRRVIKPDRALNLSFSLWQTLGQSRIFSNPGSLCSPYGPEGVNLTGSEFRRQDPFFNNDPNVPRTCQFLKVLSLALLFYCH